MIFKLCAKYPSLYYPRSIQATVALMRYLFILALISLFFYQRSYPGNEIGMGILAACILIPLCMLIRIIIMRCGNS